jgi:DNA-binding NtrC family response regulator
MPATERRTLRALVAEDDASVRRAVCRALGQLDLEVTEVPNGREAIERLTATPFEVVVSDLSMPEADGFEVLDMVRTEQPRTPVVVLTAAGTMRQCVRAMRAGAFDFVTKPFQVEVLQSAVRAALEARAAEPIRGEPTRALPPSPYLGQAPVVNELTAALERVAPTNATVLISGETGTGKELVARRLHELSARSSGPLVVVNCGSIPEGLIESELFGHVAGAFTGASAARRGRLREADGGTLFLDEIGELPLTLQPRLLRVVQERRVTPVGGEASHMVNVRFVAATNRDLGAMVRAGRFREDLYFRLNVVPLMLPALRERAGDIPLLVEHFLARASRSAGRPVAISARALVALQMHRWPGNVRELEHLILRVAILDRDGTIDLDDLPEALRQGPAETALETIEAMGEQIDLNGAVAQFEWTLIQNTLRKTGGNRSRAAAILGIGRTTLIDKIKRHGHAG